MATKKTETATATTEADALSEITNAVADRLRGEIQDGHAEVESILMAIAAEGRKPSFDESVRLRQLRPQWSDRDLNAEVRRGVMVVKAQQIAGTTADREALAVAAEKAAAELADRGAVLRAEIAEREAAVRELEQTSDRLHRRQAETQAALERLSELLPDHVEADLKARRRASSSSFAAEHNRIVAELRHRDRLKAGPGSNPLDWSDHLRRAGARVPVGQICSDAEAARLFGEWDVERDSMDRRVAELAEHIAAVEAEEAAARRHYHR
jgi:hypothetical protein